MRCNTGEELQPYAGKWGDWSHFYACPGGFSGARVRHQPYQGRGYKGSRDDTGIECVELLCKDSGFWIKPYNCGANGVQYEDR